MSCSDWAERIGELTDGSLDPAARASLDVHLRECRDCRSLAEDLARLRGLSANLEPIQPPADLWQRIAGRIELESPPRQPDRPARRWGAGPDARRWLAIAAVLTVVTGTTWWAVRTVTVDPSTTVSVSEAEQVMQELRLAETHYENAVAQLEQIAASQTAQLGTFTAAALRQNLGVIDRAIAENRAVLRAEPDNRVAQETLLEVLRRKIGLLQDVIALVHGLVTGDQLRVARAIESASQAARQP